MLEVLLAAGLRKAVYLDSGPGPQSAVGDENVGYFGEVSNAELFTAAQLAAQITELGAATVANDATTWLKFRWYGKYLFIKKMPVFTNSSSLNPTSWNGLYKVGLIHGEDTAGPYYPGSPVNQVRLVHKAPYRFKVRTITGDENTTLTQATTPSGNDQTPRRKSMFTELLYRVCADALSAYPEAKWESWPNTDLTSNSEVCRELFFSGTYPQGIPLVRGQAGTAPKIAGYVVSVTSHGVDSIRQWRPVLELVPQNVIYTLSAFGIRSTGVLPGKLAAVKFDVGSLPTDINRLSAIKVASVNIAYLSKPTGASVDGIQRLTGVRPERNSLSRVAGTSFTFNP